MTWEIFLGIVALFGFIVTVVKTILPLTNAVTLLTEQMKEMSEDMKAMNEKKTEAHKRLWDHNEEQDKKLEEHALRLHDLDGK